MQDSEKAISAILVSPRNPEPGGVLRVLAAFDRKPGAVDVVLRGPSGSVEPDSKEGGGPPYRVIAGFSHLPEGRFALDVSGKGIVPASVEVVVEQGRKASPLNRRAAAPEEGVWPTERGWTASDERLYSAWIEALFAGADERSSWDALDEVTRDPGRNVLHDHLGLGEDGPDGLELNPDCADNPYFLRAYFSWKMGLPFGFRECTRGSLARAPESLRWLTNESVEGRGGPVRSFNRFLRIVMNAIHSASARTSLETGEADTFPLPLTRESLRPGTVFADPYGHTLVIVRWVGQTEERPGALLAVDAQPDGTIGIKRFWKGNFLFSTEDVVGDPGFKAFRPLTVDRGRIRPLANEEIAGGGYGEFSLEQKNMSQADFYETMERLINPEPLDPVSAFRDLFGALHEQLLVRVESVANGEAYVKSHPGTVIPMPSSSSAVFQTMGLWEDYSTPNRDLRLLIALDTLLEFPERVAAMPESYRIPAKKIPAEMRRELMDLQGRWAAELSITYERSDGSPRVLSLGEIFERREALEMAYNPNDCVEIRWGAPEGGEEMRSCGRRAPGSQAERMKALRAWFRKRLHPPT